MIDGGPLRTSRPTGRQVEYQDEPVRYQPDEPQQTEPIVRTERPRQPQQYRQAEPQYAEPLIRAPKQPRNYSWVKWVVLVAGLALLSVAGWFFWSNNRTLEATIDTDKYQAVFLSNGQVYFGRLAIVNDDYMKLTNVFYLERQLTAETESGEEPAEESDAAMPSGDNSFQLLKYSDVLYGSEDTMVISKDDVIRYENLRSDGVVAKAIANRN